MRGCTTVGTTVPGGAGRLFRAAVIGLLFAAPVSAVTLRVQSVEVQDRVVRLGDVAAISGVPRDVADSLANTVVAYAPIPGTSRALPLETIRMRVLAEGFLPGEVRMLGEANPVVRRGGQVASPDAITQAVLDALQPLLDPSTSVHVTRVPPVAMLPSGSIRYDVQVPARLTRSFFVPVSLAVGGEIVRINVSLQAVRLGRVVAAVRRLERGTVITAADVVLKEMDDFDAPRDAIRLTADVIGATVVRSIQADLPLTTGSVERPSAVKRGDRVRLTSRVGTLEVVVEAEALEPGTPGQRVRVRNVETRRIVTARVSGAGEVIIDE